MMIYTVAIVPKSMLKTGFIRTSQQLKITIDGYFPHSVQNNSLFGTMDLCGDQAGDLVVDVFSIKDWRRMLIG